MDSEKNAGAAVPRNKPTAPENIMAQGISAKKNSKGMIFGMVLLVILAIGGIGFGVWAWMDGNAQKDSLNSQIAVLNAQNVELREQINNEGEDIDYAYKNPIITVDPPAEYWVPYSLSVFDNQTESFIKINIDIRNGKYSSCGFEGKSAECSITGLPDGIYKAALIHEGNGIGAEKIGFIMEDGSVWYVSVYDDDFNIKENMEAKELNINGFVKDVVNVGYTADADVPGSGYRSTVFVMGDDSFIKYEESML